MAHAQEGGRSLPVLSASAIEAYLQCPYSWFIGRKVRIDGLDEGFGPVEKGTFAHGVYASLFEALAAEGIRRCDDAALPHALAVLDGAYDARPSRRPARVTAWCPLPAWSGRSWLRCATSCGPACAR